MLAALLPPLPGPSDSALGAGASRRRPVDAVGAPPLLPALGDVPPSAPRSLASRPARPWDPSLPLPGRLGSGGGRGRGVPLGLELRFGPVRFVEEEELDGGGGAAAPPLAAARWAGFGGSGDW